MRKKFIGIFVCMLLITTCVIPVMADTTKDTLSVSSNDVAFDLTIKLLMKIAGFPSLTACIIKDDQMIWSKGYGYYDLSERKYATPDTIYMLASVSKTITGTALMQLYEKGLFNLDDDVNTFLPFDLRNPNFPNDPITFRMLLSHTSSLNEDPNDFYWFNFSADPPFNFYPESFLREYLIPGGRYYEPSIWNTTSQPGEYLMYANVGFEIIAYLVELISGEPFLEYCNTHIFSPLEMKHTGFNLSRFDINQVAIPYQRIRGKYYTLDDYGLPNQYWKLRCYPAGGLYSTVSDLSHFLIAHMNDGVYNNTRILKKETVELMHTPQAKNPIYGETFWYHLAWCCETIMGINVSGHGGGLLGVTTYILYNQSVNIGVVFLANSEHANFLPFGGYYSDLLIYYLLFKKEWPIKGEMQHEFIVSSVPFFLTPLKQILETHPKQ